MSGYEEHIVKILLKEKIDFLREKTFKDLKGGLLRFDFYIKEKNIIIEIDGEYHFKPIRGRATFLKQTGYDRRKNSYCLANNILLYRIPYWKIKTIKSFNDMLSEDFKVKTKWHNDLLMEGRN